MADISSMNNEQLALSPTLSEGYQGAATRRDPALEAVVSGSSGQVFSEGVSPLDQPAFRLTISQEASRLAQASGVGEAGALTEGKRAGRVGAEEDGSLRGRELSEDDQRDVKELQKEDRRVRRHEQAHAAAGGRYVRGGARYEYTNGSDGKRYATGGEVSVDLSSEKDPRATIQKMNTIRRAALAPADPSAADRSVAATATRKAAEARQELSETQRQESQGAPGQAGGAGSVESPIRSNRATPSSAPDSPATASLKTGLLRAISTVTAPPPPGLSRIDGYA